MSRPRIVIVGAGFAGYRAARALSRLTRHKAEVTLLNPTDYFLYLPLLPQVAAGILEPRRVTVSLTGTLPDVRLVLGEADAVDLDGHTVRYTGPEGDGGTLPFDRLILAAGSVNKLLPIPGVAEHAHGFRGLPEALYLRDHVTRQMELAAAADDPASCAERCTFVVVGAGYTGTEVAAQGKLFTDSQLRRRPLRAGMRPRWLLLDIAGRVLPELDESLSRTADRVLRQRGVEVRMGTSVKEATHRGVLLTDGESVDTRTLVWCVGVRPDPLAESLELPLEKGRLLVDPYLQVPGRPALFAVGDAAAVPDLENPGAYTPMTAQHAWRQGKAVAHNVAASLGLGERRAYRHRDLGFVVDLGGVKAAANPLGIPLSGVAAGAVTRGYHLAAMPGNRVRVAADWLLDAVLPRQAVQLGLVRSWSVPLDTASPEVARVPGGPGKARAGSTVPAEGSRAVEGAEPTDRIRDPDAAKHAEPPGPVKEPDPVLDSEAARHGEPSGSVKESDSVQDSGVARHAGSPGPVKESDPVLDSEAARHGEPSGSVKESDPVQDPGAARHAEPPGPVKQPDLIQASEHTPGASSSDAPAVHKHRPRDPSALAPPEPRSPASSEGDS
ncbi:FAD-dependent oxidoreductase [Streptomyces sp. bgisy034]|uniref:NAD(P)/FAD-dependent oxidoreductase n=1 Tax=Streptomyces sp. bgisy034 TaxID=3413774 RepID=UPI003EBC7308